jgi:outer membrane scaffolding protein for murein synthesis (MipA/OmpV family)
MSPAGIIGCSLQYHPTTVEGETEQFYNGFLLDLSYAKMFPINQKTALTGMTGISLMDENYADAWFTVEKTTQKLENFNAGAGLRDFQLSMQLEHAVSQNVGVTLLMENSWLLMDAKKSPYTQSTYQITWALFGVYSF